MTMENQNETKSADSENCIQQLMKTITYDEEYAAQSNEIGSNNPQPNTDYSPNEINRLRKILKKEQIKIDTLQMEVQKIVNRNKAYEVEMRNKLLAEANAILEETIEIKKKTQKERDRKAFLKYLKIKGNVDVELKEKKRPPSKSSAI